MHEEMRNALNDMKAHAEDRLDKMNLQRLEGNRPPLSADSEEQAQELENEEVIEGLDETYIEQLGKIEAALTRIDKGTYGICVECEEPIAPARLKAVPFASHCIECANAQA